MNTLNPQPVPPPPKEGPRDVDGGTQPSSLSSSSSCSSSSSSSSSSSFSSVHGHSLAGPPELPGILAGDPAGLLPPEQAQRVRERVRKMCGWSRESFPGGQPVSLSKSNLTELFRNPYVACEKTDGIRFLLLAASGCIFLIGRKEEVRMIPDKFLPRKGRLQEPQQLTLLDGELVMDRLPDGDTAARYLIYDAICIERDESVKELNLMGRLAAVAERVIAPLRELEEKERLQSEREEDAPQPLKKRKARKNPLEIYLKDFFEIFDLLHIQRMALRLPHESDGIIFTPVNLPYTTGTCRQLLKWKPPHLNTVDFSADALYDERGVPRLFQLYVTDYGVRVFKGEFLAPYGALYKQLLQMASSTRLSGTIVECFWFPSPPVYTFVPSLRSAEDLRSEKEMCTWQTWNAAKPLYDLENGTWKEGGWVAERIRTDKNLPNSFQVMKKVQQSIDDSITFRTLLREAQRYRNHGKKTVGEACILPSEHTEDKEASSTETSG
uniref:mRNA guanylyltransferase n=1 Tax=Neospora caninum (strain Liverpool) TaxID=572307 RepID=A0A0F7UKH2_NEOCL|nr:TPA: AT3g09100/MZB10_13, related [Neospora caninum Liverpool]